VKAIIHISSKSLIELRSCWQFRSVPALSTLLKIFSIFSFPSNSSPHGLQPLQRFGFQLGQLLFVVCCTSAQAVLHDLFCLRRLVWRGIPRRQRLPRQILTPNQAAIKPLLKAHELCLHARFSGGDGSLAVLRATANKAPRKGVLMELSRPLSV
jgi:hypothetical protein